MVLTEIDGLMVTPLKQINDERGAVLHMLRNDAVNFKQFGECYFSEIIPGALKAWKRHTIQTQNLAVPIGRIRLVMYDNRETSKTKENLLIIELGRPDAYQLVQIPPGIWYGFSCISSTAALVANCADYPHSKEESDVLEPDNKSIPYSWNGKGKL